MSKAQTGPPATSFINPRKTGWLYKHGGSGLSSHWKKRWFITDDHYLFYYKGPSDKKPVGILCLPEYASCRKANVKEWKKPFSFVLGRFEGNHENTDGGNSAAGKDYVLYSESEGDMNTWIKALQEEMKSSMFSNGGLSTTSSGSSKVKVDQKAIEEVTKAASDGPKLTHLTAQRPKVRGRRPPKRYATYHEEDKDESPPDTPTSEHKMSTTPPHPASPSPTASPTAHIKGHRPTVPLMPKQRCHTSSSSPPPPLSESPKKQPPPPPTKPIPETEEEGTAPTPKQRPIPPKRPLKPRTATNVPVQAPRPMPVPRKVGGKDVQIDKSPRRELPSEVENSDHELLKAESVSKLSDASDECLDEPETINEPCTTAGDVEHKNGHTMMNDVLPTATCDTTSATSPSRETILGSTIPPVEMEVTGNTSVVADNSHSPNTSTDEYEHMTPGVTKGGLAKTKSPEYDEPVERDMTESPPMSTQKDVEYAVPSPVSKQAENTYAVPKSTGTPAVDIASSTPQIPVVTATDEENLTAGRGTNQPPPHGSSADHLKPFHIERDALGYSKVMKKKEKLDSPILSDDEPPPPPLWIGTDRELMTGNVPSTLQQSREILRLAQILKKEVEDMRREVQQELEMARRERQDAEVLKKNAIEILRMAKEKLNQKPPT